MAKAFTDEEKDIIKNKLKLAARECASKYGMKKTTVDELAKEVGISKGAFYIFYDSKELLFFEMMEDLHEEIYTNAARALIESEGEEESDRLAKAFMTALKSMAENNLMYFLENEIEFLLRKIPKEVKEKHYHSDDFHIKELMELTNFNFSVSYEVASAVVRALILTASKRKEIGEDFDEVIWILVKGACENMLKR